MVFSLIVNLHATFRCSYSLYLFFNTFLFSSSMDDRSTCLKRILSLVFVCVCVCVRIIFSFSLLFYIVSNVCLCTSSHSLLSSISVFFLFCFWMKKFLSMCVRSREIRIILGIKVNKMTLHEHYTRADHVNRTILLQINSLRPGITCRWTEETANEGTESRCSFQSRSLCIDGYCSSSRGRA